MAAVGPSFWANGRSITLYYFQSIIPIDSYEGFIGPTIAPYGDFGLPAIRTIASEGVADFWELEALLGVELDSEKTSIDNDPFYLGFRGISPLTGE